MVFDTFNRIKLKINLDYLQLDLEIQTKKEDFLWGIEPTNRNAYIW